MPQVPDYERQFDFTDFSTNYPSTPHRGDKIDEELNEVQRVLDAVKANLNLIQRSDGQVKNLSVGLDQLKPEIVLGTPTDWATGVEYEMKDVVWRNDVLYVCNVDHTSGTFATDLAAEYWTDYLDYADPLGDAADFAVAAGESADDAAASATAAATSATDAETAQTAAEAAQAAAEAAIDAITFPLGVGFGGTGGTTEATALSGLGFSSFAQSYRAAVDLAAHVTALGGAAAMKALLDLEIGTDVQAYSARLTEIAALAVTDSNIIVGNGSAWVAESGATARTSLGVGPTDDVTLKSLTASNSAGATTAAGRFTNTTDSASVRGLLIEGDRATPTTFDVIYMSFGLSDASGNQDEFGRIDVMGADLVNASEDARMRFSIIVAGSMTVKAYLDNSAWQPNTNDGCALGLSSTSWSDLFLASGAVLNFNAGNVTVTHAAGVLTLAGGDLVLADIAPTSVRSTGFRGSPVIDGNAAYAFPAIDAGKTIYHDEAGARTYTIPANASVAHPIGTMFIIDNTGNSGAAGVITLAITTDTLRRGDGTAGTGSRTIAASAVAVIRKVAATIWIITGVFT